MVQPSGPIAILCGVNSAGEIIPADIDANRQIKVLTASTTVDASDVTYTPTTASDWDGGVDPGNQNSANDQLAERVKTVEGLMADDYLPVRASWLHYDNVVLTGNSIAVTIDTTRILGHYAFQSASAIGDSNINSCVLKAGSYTIRLYCHTGPAGGQLDLDFKHIDDAGYTNIVTNSEFYSAGVGANVVKTFTFTVTTAGRHLFRFSTNSKHASASAYNIIITRTDIYLTAGDS